MIKIADRLIFALLFLLIFSSCSSLGPKEKNLRGSYFVSLEDELTTSLAETIEISSLSFNENSKVIIWMHGTNRPSIAGNLNCSDDMPPESLMVAAEKLDFSIYYLCSNATDGFEKGSFIYKRVSELEETISHFNMAGIPSKNIFLSGFSAGGWTALMAASILPDSFNGGVLFAPAFSGPRYETTIFPVWRKVIRPKQINEISKAKRLNFLVFAYEDDPFNRPKDLDFLLNRKNSHPEIIGYNCNKGHFTYKKDCKGSETSSRILTFLQESES